MYNGLKPRFNFHSSANAFFREPMICQCENQHMPVYHVFKETQNVTNCRISNKLQPEVSSRRETNTFFSRSENGPERTQYGTTEIRAWVTQQGYSMDCMHCKSNAVRFICFPISHLEAMNAINRIYCTHDETLITPAPGMCETTCTGLRQTALEIPKPAVAGTGKTCTISRRREAMSTQQKHFSLADIDKNIT